MCSVKMCACTSLVKLDSAHPYLLLCRTEAIQINLNLENKELQKPTLCEKSQDTVVLGKNGRLLSILSENRGIESRRQLLLFERTTETRKKKGDKFGNEDRRHTRKTNDHRRVTDDILCESWKMWRYKDR